jgi:hypothetical protein
MATEKLLAPDVLRKLIEYDPETGELTWRPRSEEWFKTGASCRKWNTRFAGMAAFPKPTTLGYRSGRVAGQHLKGHRVAWAIHHGSWPDGFIDHINGDRADNRIENLRVVSRAGNNRNRKRPNVNTSGVIGVCRDKNTMKWQAYASHNGARLYFGSFDTVKEAAEARRIGIESLGFHPNHGRC